MRNIKNEDAEYDFLCLREKEYFLESLEELKLQLCGEKEMLPHKEYYLALVFIFTNRYGYKEISETDFQRYLASQFSPTQFDIPALEFIVGIFKDMADCIVEGIDEFIEIVSKSTDTEKNRRDRAVLTLHRLNSYLSKKDGEKDPSFRLAVLTIIDLIRESAEKRTFTASNYD